MYKSYQGFDSIVMYNFLVSSFVDLNFDQVFERGDAGSSGSTFLTNS